MEYTWAMPHKWTFSVKPIAELLIQELEGIEPIIDPFSGMNSPAHVKNDLNPETDAEYHLDAVEFLDLMIEEFGHGYFNGGLFDPPFSYRQASECYKKFGLADITARVTSAKYRSDVRSRLAILLSKDAVNVSCGWNSTGIGKKHGFVKTRILLVCHGGDHNDTIVTVEKRGNVLENL